MYRKLQKAMKVQRFGNLLKQAAIKWDRDDAAWLFKIPYKIKIRR